MAKKDKEQEAYEPKVGDKVVYEHNGKAKKAKVVLVAKDRVDVQATEENSYYPNVDVALLKAAE
jgi:hypothetical protein